MEKNYLCYKLLIAKGKCYNSIKKENLVRLGAALAHKIIRENKIALKIAKRKRTGALLPAACHSLIGENAVKRLMDIIFSVVLIILLSPVGVFLAVLIKITSPGEVLFKQLRLGQSGKIFNMYKFRTMIQGAQNMGSGMYLEENDSRITPLGKWLRKTSLDELPQLFNVLKGEMSLVGPRPAPLHHLAVYNEVQKKRLLMKPGITGWAQVKGRNEVLWPERIKYDLWYLKNYSFFLDLKIIWATVTMVFFQKGIQGNPERRKTDPFNQGF
ncbi:MAG: sugar transferase [Desulfitobacteriaceae bacterium]|nr:sugar transferase [Desulfitobacteriaceae bacterium]MDD4752271.1 sugar transferase [Desulfitobacteriaceae bacterium]